MIKRRSFHRLLSACIDCEHRDHFTNLNKGALAEIIGSEFFIS